MTLQEMFERILVQSGQFLIDPSNIELDQDKFKFVVKRALGIYNTHSPAVSHIFKQIQSSKQFVFTEENTPEGIPDYISDVIPMRISGVMPFHLRDEVRHNPQLQVKQSFPWEYRKPVLTVPVQADYDITAVTKHRLTSKDDGSGGTVHEVKTIKEEDHLFFDLLTANFLRGIARSRRAFTLEDLPITTDASDLISEADDLETTTKEDLSENHSKWYLAWR